MSNDLLGYSLNHKDTIQTVPSLDELILNNDSSGSYNKSNFIKFLSNSHCLENLEFILELKCYLNLKDEEEKKRLWAVIYKNFLLIDSAREINLPYKVRKNFNGDSLPNVKDLLNAKSVIYELLLDSYNEFIKYIRLTTHDRKRRKSEIIPPDDSYNENNLITKCIPRSISISEPSPYSSTSSPFVVDEEVDSHKSRTNSNSNSSSRGSSIGSVVETLKNNELISWKKTVKKFKFRRFSNDD